MEYKEYYVYNEKGVGGSMNTGGIRIHPDAISFCPSGLVDQQKNVILSHLHKGIIKDVNQLRMIEDSFGYLQNIQSEKEESLRLMLVIY